MANVTYLLGAGASYNALPIVDELPKAINGVIGQLKRRKNASIPFEDYNEPAYQEALQIAIDDLSLLERGTIDHLSIDTFAKMLFLTNNDNYERVKFAISIFFQLYHYLKWHIIIDDNTPPFNTELQHKRRHTTLDKRYDAFLASILQNSYDNFPDNIRILSYNYDDQFERSYNNYIINAKTDKTIADLMNIYRRNQKSSTFESNKFSFFKINGTAGFFDSDENLKETYDISIDYPDVHIRALLDNYAKYRKEKSCYKSSISFAWDHPENTQILLKNIKQATKETHHLVIIGYSLPFFNRRIDYEIIRNMKDLRKIYIQDPNAEEIKDRLIPIRTSQQIPIDIIAKQLIAVKNTKQFYLPDELT